MSPALAAQEAPAAGAAIDQVIIATAFGLGVTAAVVALCLGHRSGRVPVLGWAGWISERWGGLPGWAGLPGLIALVTLLPTLFGLQWDESLHISEGRDEGPLANPSHYLLLMGIFGAFSAGLIAMAMADRRVPRSGIAIPGAWRVPLGGALTTLGASVALLGFPLDDVWHRLYGQDITLWSPTHVMMIAGMSLSVLGVVVLVVEGLRSRHEHGLAPLGPGPEGRPPFLVRALQTVLLPADARRPGLRRRSPLLVRGLLAVMLPAALLLVLSLLQGEFDYGVPQYRLLMHPMIVMAAAGTALVAARIFCGAGAALAAVLGFLAIRGLISVLVGPVLGNPWHIFPLYLVEAGLVELVALRVSVRRPLRFGAVSGVLIGTVGLAAEWGWSSLFPIPWNGALLPEAALLGLAMALAGGVLGAWLGSHLMVTGAVRTVALRRSALAAAAAITAMVAFGLHEGEAGESIRGSVTLTEVTPAPERSVHATLRLDPADAADDAAWMSTIAWQGGGLEVEHMREVEPGTWTTRQPLPVHGEWKTALRLHAGDQLVAVPVFLPEDAAIPATEVPAPASFERRFVGEKPLLQREAKDVGEGLITLGTWIVAALMFGLLGVFAAALHRLAVTAPPSRGPAVGGPPAAAAEPSRPRPRQPAPA